MAEPLKEAVRQPDVSINSGPPVNTTQPGVELEVDVSHLHSLVTVLILVLTYP